MVAHSFLIESSSKLLVTGTGKKARTSSISGSGFHGPFTGHSCYVDFAYLDTTTYVEVIFHSQQFFSIFLCISSLSMSKTVNMKQRVFRGDFSCPRHIFYYSCYCLCRSIKSALAWAPYCLLRLCPCLSCKHLPNNNKNQSDLPSFD